jgi:asparagine synthase (glutamine-hydrolysing)
MCGICGIFNLNNNNICIEEFDVVNMASELMHRGPDDTGYLIKKDFGIGFKRLSIVDLISGNQPITNENNSLSLVCNGEIFNYKELRHELQCKGHIFKTETDIEVIIHLYEEYGKNLVQKLNGQFAFALIDEKIKKIFIFRDHFGIIPLFYSITQGVLIFASEIKALLKHKFVDRQVDLTGLDQFFSLPGTVSPRTMFKNISSLPPGHFIIGSFGDPDIKVCEYWDIVYPKEEENKIIYKEEYYKEKLEELLLKSIRYRLQADVPVGAFLSGGLDSSLIVGMIKSLSIDTMKIFSIIFDNQLFSEEKYQQIVIDETNFDHHKIKFQTEDVFNRLEKVIWHSETPLKETYNTATLALSSMASEKNTKVILTGEGSDELFAGYPSYRFDAFRRKRNFNISLNDEENKLRLKLWGDKDFKYEKDHYSYKLTKKKLYSNQLNKIYDEFDFTNFEVVNKKRIQGIHPIHKRSYLDMKLRLADHLISDHSDRMLMANSIEGRFPFLDIDLVDFATQIPSELKLNNFQEKYILKKVARKYVPSQIIEREKFIFSAPGSPYFLQTKNEWILDLLSYETIKKQGYFNPEEIGKLTKKYSQPGFILNTSIEEDTLLMIINFGIFLNLFDLPNF